MAVRARSMLGLSVCLPVVCLATVLLERSSAPLGAQDPQGAPLDAPAGVRVCQIEYGRQGAVLISWSNAESYESVELSLDDQLAPGAVDGTFGTGRVQASPGRHVFGVRGLVGERRSPWSTAELTLLDETPVPTPIKNLECKELLGGGGRLRLTWELGPDAWVSGRLEVLGQGGAVEIPAGAVSAEVALAPPSDGTDANDPKVARVAFKNADNYFSEPLTAICLLQGPEFRRGDCDGTGGINITDAIYLLSHLFLGGRRWRCDDACDSNDDGRIDLTDPISTLGYLFQGRDPLPLPGPRLCGADSTEDFLGGICTCAD